MRLPKSCSPNFLPFLTAYENSVLISQFLVNEKHPVSGESRLKVTTASVNAHNSSHCSCGCVLSRKSLKVFDYKRLGKLTKYTKSLISLRG